MGCVCVCCEKGVEDDATSWLLAHASLRPRCTDIMYVVCRIVNQYGQLKIVVGVGVVQVGVGL